MSHPCAFNHERKSVDKCGGNAVLSALTFTECKKNEWEKIVDIRSENINRGGWSVCMRDSCETTNVL